MRLIRIFFRNLANAFKSIFRNISLSSASLLCTTITLFIVAVGVIVTENINDFTRNLTKSLSIVAFVDSGSSNEEIERIKNEISSIENVKTDEIIYKDRKTVKEETLEKAEKGSTIYTIVSTWEDDNNPLQPEFIIYVKDAKKLEKTADDISNIDKVKSVKYAKEVNKQMTPVIDIIQKISIIIIIGLIVVTVFLIGNTIKLTIYARSEEIEIMRLVGISNTVIRLPFVIEGTILGFLGSIIPIAVTIWGYTICYDRLGGILFSPIIKMIEPMPFTLYTSLILLAIGGVVGMTGSYMAVRRYLKV